MPTNKPQKSGKRRRREIWYLDYVYSDGMADRMGSLELREGRWLVRYLSCEGKTIELMSETSDKMVAASLLLSRWREEQRKMDAEALLSARKRAEELSDPETRRVLSHGLFDAMVDFTTRAGHRALDGAIAPLDWWQGPGSAYAPPLGFGCRCALISITAGRADRMIESGEGFDLTRGVPAETVPDQQWQEWAATFTRVWDKETRRGTSQEEAKRDALAAANSNVTTDPVADLEAVRWST